MALNRPALVDALTDAGLEAEAVRRAVDVLEQDYADTAKQAEMHLRFSALEKSLADHDRLNETQSKSLEARMQDFKEEVERRFVDLKEVMDREIASVRNELGTEIAALRNEMRTEFAAVRSEIGGLRNEMQTEFAAVRREMTMMRWVVGSLFVMNATTLGIVIDKLL